MYLRRKIDDYLKEWKNSEERKPLIIKGARQIGKTESIRKFAEENYTSVGGAKVSYNYCGRIWGG